MLIPEGWGKSGRGAKRHLGTEYGRLLTMIAADRVSAIYAYNLVTSVADGQDAASLTLDVAFPKPAPA